MASPTSESFSRRNNYQLPKPPITIWEGCPDAFRFAVLQIAKQDCKLTSDRLRDIICRELRTTPDSSNWSEPNIWNEVQSLVDRCEWYQVYDIIERIALELEGKRIHDRSPMELADVVFEQEVNRELVDHGIGWKLEGGQVQARSEDGYETYLQSVEESLRESNKSTSLTELNEAIADVSRRPEPDTTGAIQHAAAALECVAREVCEDSKNTLGFLAKHNPSFFPQPLGKAAEMLWGYASENARHGREGNNPSREEAFLVVGISAALINYLVHKQVIN